MYKFLLILLFPVALFGQGNPVVFSGSVDSPTFNGYVTADSVHYRHPKSRIGAYISTPSNTTIGTPNQYEFFKSTFTNVLTYGYTFSGDTVVFDNGGGYTHTGGYNFSLTSSEPNTTVTMTVTIAGVSCPFSTVTSLLKSTGEYYELHGNIFCKLIHGDKIKILIKADKACTITPLQGSTYLFELL